MDEIADFKRLTRAGEFPFSLISQLWKTVWSDEALDELLGRLTESGQHKKACAVALAMCSGRRKAPLALNTELLTLIHPGIKERLELLCQCVAVNELAEAKPLGLDRLARLIKRTAADEILLLEVVHTESAQLRLTPTATHCKRNSASLLMLAAFPRLQSGIMRPIRTGLSMRTETLRLG